LGAKKKMGRRALGTGELFTTEEGDLGRAQNSTATVRWIGVVRDPHD